MKTKASFAFRANKETGIKRPAVEITIEAPDSAEIISLLQSTDPADLSTQTMVLEEITGIITSHLRSFVEDDPEFCQDTYDELYAEGKTSLNHIANLPRAERNVLSKEDLEAFAADYILVMPEITGKEVSRVRLTAELVVEKFKRISGDQASLEIVKNNLILFAEKAPEAMVETHARVLNWAFAKLASFQEVKVEAGDL